MVLWATSLNHSPIEGHLDCLLRNSLFFFFSSFVIEIIPSVILFSKNLFEQRDLYISSMSGRWVGKGRGGECVGGKRKYRILS